MKIFVLRIWENDTFVALFFYPLSMLVSDDSECTVMSGSIVMCQDYDCNMTQAGVISAIKMFKIINREAIAAKLAECTLTRSEGRGFDSHLWWSGAETWIMVWAMVMMMSQMMMSHWFRESGQHSAMWPPFVFIKEAEPSLNVMSCRIVLCQDYVCNMTQAGSYLPRLIRVQHPGHVITLDQ